MRRLNCATDIVDASKRETTMIIDEASRLGCLLLQLTDKSVDDSRFDRKTSLTAKLGAGIFCQMVNDTRIFKDTKGMWIEVRFMRLVHHPRSKLATAALTASSVQHSNRLVLDVLRVRNAASRTCPFSSAPLKAAAGVRRTPLSSTSPPGFRA